VTARLYFGHARDDRSMPAEAIAKFEEALARLAAATRAFAKLAALLLDVLP
jgi:hypothetical protein